MPLPPDDDLLESLLEQLGGALEGLPVDVDATKGALEDGLREALAELNTPSSDGPPTMRVLQGGRGDDDTPDDAPTNDDAPVRLASRRVVRTASTHNVSRRGSIALEGPDDWQTVYRGAVVATYRVLSTRGRLQVSLDGTLVEQISPGRSTDLCGEVIRLRSDTPATGIYVRLD